MPRYPQGGGGQIDMSGIAGLGDFGQNALGMVLAQQQQDAQMNLARRAQAAEEANAAAQNEIRRQISERESADAEKQRAAQRQGRLLDLAQIVPDGDAFMKLAPLMAPDLKPEEIQAYATFADVTSQRKKEAEKAAKEEKEQSMLRGFVPGMMGGLANLPPDVQQRAIAGLGEQAGLPPEILGLTVLSEKARQEEKAAKEAAANARASMRAGASLENAAATREATQAHRDTVQQTTIRKEFNGLSKDFLKQRDGFQRVLSSAKEPTAAGDLALIFNYMKVLDPGSVVRESEFATAAATGAYGERVKGAVERIASGKRLSNAQRADFVSRSKSLFRDAAKNQKGLERRYRKLGKRQGLDPNAVATDFIGDLWRESGPPPSPPPAEEGAVFLKKQDGNPVFVRPDGSQFMVAP